MATTIKNATLKVTIKEEIVLNGSRQDSENILRISGIANTVKRIVTCTASQSTTIATFANDVYETVGAIDIEDSKYIRVTNLDGANAVELAVVTVGTTYQVKLDAGHSHILGSADDAMLAEADTTPSFGTMADIKSLQINPSSNAVDIEIFVASA